MADSRDERPPKGPNDDIFSRPVDRARDFNFGKETAAVFDDMLNRSVPFYNEIQRQVSELVADFAAEGTNIYDLGCSTCNTLLAIDETLPPDLDVGYVGIDSSEEMLEEARHKLDEAGVKRKYVLEHADLNSGVTVMNASVALMVLTLQFVRPLYRDRLINSIYQGLNENGCLILVEKVLGEGSTFNRLFIEHYYEMKRRHGYSDMEISQKREALENVLIPYRLDENIHLLRKEGFREVDIFFKWYNFCAIIARK
ncbi:MAG: carboxy-S-adenosyl-L-methionine synthase CmoA [Myxococcota bacterium]